MLAVLQLIGAFVADLFKSRPAMLCDYFKPRRQLEAEILVLRHQLSVLQQRAPRRRLHLRWADRALFIWLYRRYPRILNAITIVSLLPTSGSYTELYGIRRAS
jgi:hypothetical protein